MRTIKKGTQRSYAFGVRCGVVRLAAQLTREDGGPISWSASIKRSAMRNGAFSQSQHTRMLIGRVLSQLSKISKVHGSGSMTVSEDIMVKVCNTSAYSSNISRVVTTCIFYSTLERSTTFMITKSGHLLMSSVILSVDGSDNQWLKLGEDGAAMFAGFGRIALKPLMSGWLSGTSSST